MCLAVPGEVIAVAANDDELLRTAQVRFGGAVREVSLAALPDTRVGDWVLVHVGVALQKIDPARADAVFRWLEEAVDKVDEAAVGDVENVEKADAG